jgi:hypothetical protein
MTFSNSGEKRALQHRPAMRITKDRTRRTFTNCQAGLRVIGRDSSTIKGGPEQRREVE